MKLYFAGPLFTTPERTWNAEVTAALRAAGHEVYLPQEQETGMDAAGIFATDVGGIDWADGLVAIMDGPDPDSGTSWEVGYAFGLKKWIVLVRTDIRGTCRLGRRLQLDARRGRDDPDRLARGIDRPGHRDDPRCPRPHRNWERLVSYPVTPSKRPAPSWAGLLCPSCPVWLVDVLQRRDHEVIRQLHAGRVVRAVAARVLVEVLLVVVLGVVERVRRGIDDLGRDRAVALGR